MGYFAASLASTYNKPAAANTPVPYPRSCDNSCYKDKQWEGKSRRAWKSWESLEIHAFVKSMAIVDLWPVIKYLITWALGLLYKAVFYINKTEKEDFQLTIWNTS